MYLLKDLWNGNISPIDRVIRQGSEYQKLLEETNICMEQLIAELSPEGATILEKFYDKTINLGVIAEEDCFIQGVRIGAKLILDVLGEYKSQLPRSIEE